MYSLHSLKPAPHSKKSHRRLGRGHGSGRGKTAGRGTKGQKARTGGRGGLKRLGMKRILLAQPKLRGFKSITPKPLTANLDAIMRCFDAGQVVTPRALERVGLIAHVRYGAKVLGSGTCTKVLTFKGVQASTGAQKKIEAAGGAVVATERS